MSGYIDCQVTITSYNDAVLRVGASEYAGRPKLSPDELGNKLLAASSDDNSSVVWRAAHDKDEEKERDGSPEGQRVEELCRGGPCGARSPRRFRAWGSSTATRGLRCRAGRR